MTRTSVWVAVLVVLALAVGQAPFAQAAPLQQGTTTDVTIVSITETYDSGTGLVDGYDVTYSYQGGYTETVHLTIQQAYDWGLLQDDGSGSAYYIDPVTLNPVLIVFANDPIQVLTDLVGPDPCATPDGGGQPVGAALTGMFCGSQGVSYDTIMAYQASGYGFGVIAQALWMAQVLDSADPTLFEAILAAKQTKDYAAIITQLDGMGYDTSTVKNWNWGQLKKLVMASEMKNLSNLGAIMSGRVDPLVAPLTTTTTTTTTTVTTNTSTNPGNGKGKAKGQNGGGNGNNGNGNGNGNNGNNGNANGKNKGN
jgi:hypothetical protein